ncbi:50S ribosomal protein L10 [Arachnia propionica]|uniref:Large ribosomal subunit protein uL10 n=1 Tax=Arachnia propionica TaxID=1750 RepID=A0A3P1T9N9_9ACTN|nr:50S ribosomal protein L10 [Arachnia propionica]MDO5082722.1 50S ribosomal protein L10 [Arachnia propionica]RRD06008.1 50S ribosomal protein L10 [Arachnia propionica]
MARPEKAAKVAELSEAFTNSAAVVLTEYRGLSVKDLQELRRSFGGEATYAVAKNTLAALAAKDAGIEGVEETLTGPTAFTFISGDIAKVTKGLRDFAKAHPFLVIKGGVLEGKFLDAKAVLKLADLESREVLLSKMAGAMKGSLAKAAGTLAAPLSKGARLFGALQSKAAEDPNIIGGAGSAPAAETTNEDAATGDVTPADEAN